MRITKVILETEEGVTLTAEGNAIHNVEMEWQADFTTKADLGRLIKEPTGFGQFIIKLELRCYGERPNRPKPPMIE